MAPHEQRSEDPSADREAALRVSDRERERAVELLSEHAAEGRLSLAELEARIDGALAARTRGELAALTRDLPASGRGDRPAVARRRVARGPLPHQLIAFVAVNLVLVAIWALGGGGYFWSAWPILGWGVALAKGGPCARRRAGRGRPHGEPARRLTRATGAAG